MLSDASSEGPTAEDLAAIENEWPLIDAELDLVAAEIRVLTVEPHPSDLDWQRLRRAERRVGREIKAFHARLTRSIAPGRAA